MGRKSVNPNKTLYQLTRESLNLTREAAAQRSGFLAPERIEKIENRRSNPHPEDILALARVYRKPHLCNHYCANECPIGKIYVPEVRERELSSVVLEILASLNSIEKHKERLIEITADGDISPDEYEDFSVIQQQLERVSVIIETLQLWVEQVTSRDPRYTPKTAE